MDLKLEGGYRDVKRDAACCSSQFSWRFLATHIFRLRMTYVPNLVADDFFTKRSQFFPEKSELLRLETMTYQRMKTALIGFPAMSLVLLLCCQQG